MMQIKGNARWKRCSNSWGERILCTHSAVLGDFFATGLSVGASEDRIFSVWMVTWKMLLRMTEGLWSPPGGSCSPKGTFQCLGARLAR